MRRVDAMNRDSFRQRQKILDVVRNIPPGQTASYGEVARRAGLPGRARWVARVLADNDDTLTPWHRVLRSDGRIVFPVGSASFIEQLKRLQAEGVSLQGDRVRKPPKTLDQWLWEAKS